MGVQVIKYLFVIGILTSCSALKQEREMYREAAFCTCLNKNMKRVDSTYVQNATDVSNSMILMNESVNPTVFNEVISYADSMTSTVYQNTSHTTSEVGEGTHFVPLSCIRFYNSDDLMRYIKGRMKANK